MGLEVAPAASAPTKSLGSSPGDVSKRRGSALKRRGSGVPLAMASPPSAGGKAANVGPAPSSSAGGERGGGGTATITTAINNDTNSAVSKSSVTIGGAAAASEQLNNAIKAVGNTAALPYDEVPEELCLPDHYGNGDFFGASRTSNPHALDLSRWTLVVKDSTLQTAARLNLERIHRKARESAEAQVAAHVKKEGIAGIGGQRVSRRGTDTAREEGTARPSRGSGTSLPAAGGEGGVATKSFPPTPPPPAGFTSFEEDMTLEEMEASMDPKAMVSWRERQYLHQMRRLAYDKAVGTFTDSEGLREVNLNGAAHVGDLGLSALGEGCRSLRFVDISDASLVTDVSIRTLATSCRRLQVLEMANCTSVTGPGVAVVGECCPELRELNLAGCRQISRWVLTKLFNGCPLLEKLNLSFCNKVGDQELASLAKNCTHLRHLRLPQCCQISDEGVMKVAKACPDLEYLDLSRRDFSFKLNDVTLLALGENCKALHHLNLAGCDNVTDVGVNWLSLGCHALEYLNLSKCVKISNAGMTSLAEHCPHLSWLSLRNLKLITDVGVGVLAEGCKALQHVDLSGIYLLSDGTQRDFAMAGVQALGQCCPGLLSLKVDRCFQLKRLALAAIGQGLGKLQTLSLQSCSDMTLRGLSALAAGCSSLTSLDLTDCGEVVCDALLHDFARRCGPSLRHLNLSHCRYFGRAGLKSVCQRCHRLTSLNLTGCKGLQDSAMIYFEEYSLPLLTSAILFDCKELTSAGVQWLADGCPSLATLNVRGTKATSAGITVLAERYPYSRVKSTEAWLGIVPLSRTPDRINMKHYHSMSVGVVKIQSSYRIVVARKEKARRAEMRVMEWLAERLLRLWRKKKGMEYLKMLQKAREKNVKAAVLIQTIWRKGLARMLRAELEEARRQRWITERVIDIQRVWRGVLARRRAAILVILREEQRRIHEAAARLLQRHYRGHVARRQFFILRSEARELWRRQDQAARRVQKSYRGFRARANLNELKRRLRLLREREGGSATVLQKNFRSWRCRNILHEKLVLRAHRDASAITIQRHYRGSVQRVRFVALRKAWKEAVQIQASLDIQRVWRGRGARLAVKALQQERGSKLAQMEEAAVYIQRRYRGACVKRDAVGLRQEHLEEIKQLVKLNAWAATAIQAGWRGCLGVREAKERKLLHMARWKEMFDTDKQCNFYYNKVSGEVRWRRPQDFLELLPRPTCSDCELFEAYAECATCNEYFCSACWTKVHKGGKRKFHNFRTIYDYYGQRVDYGEGDFPSKWPTDIEQDDINGYQLRVAPEREPTEVQGEWERYEAAAVTEGGAEVGAHERDFFYNSRTGESLYDAPEGWVEGAGLYDNSLGWDQQQQQQQQSYGQLEYGQQEQVYGQDQQPYEQLEYGQEQQQQQVSDESWDYEPLANESAFWQGHNHQEGQQQLHTQGWGGEAGAYNEQQLVVRQGEPEQLLAKDGSVWEVHFDDQSIAYYYSHSSGESTYERPEVE